MTIVLIIPSAIASQERISTWLTRNARIVHIGCADDLTTALKEIGRMYPGYLVVGEPGAGDRALPRKTGTASACVMIPPDSRHTARCLYVGLDFPSSADGSCHALDMLNELFINTADRGQSQERGRGGLPGYDAAVGTTE